MSKITKTGVVLGGYIAAFAVASVLVYIRQLLTSDAVAQASSGMSAFGDLMLFLMIFTVLALIPTGFALYFLRPYKKFWMALSIAALAVAITAPVGVCLSAPTSGSADPKSTLAMAGGFGFLRAICAPLLVMSFLVCAAFAPSRRPRWVLLLATTFECAASAYFFVHLWIARGL